MLKTIFIISVLTARVAFPGVAPVQGPDTSTAVPAIKTVSFDLFSAQKPSAGSQASVYVPSGLKLGKSVRMLKGAAPAIPKQPADPAEKQVIKQYFGSGDAVAQGQPIGGFGAGQFVGPYVGKNAALPRTSYFYWPLGQEAENAKSESARGQYRLNTTFAGVAAIDLGDDQDFLAPFNLKNLPKKVDFTKPVVLEWDAVPSALGYLIIAVGGGGNETVVWSSSKTANPPEAANLEPYTAEEIKNMLDRGTLLSPETLICTIPSGIFKDSKTVMLTGLALGKDSISQTGVVETRVILRSMVTIPLVSGNQ